MHDDVESFYTNSIPNESRCTSFEVGFLGSKGRYRAEVSGIAFV